MAGINRNSYYDRSGGNWRQSESLLRARRPYLFKNIALGAGLFAFTGAIYIYTMKAVGQDEFEDVKVPDAPVNAVNAQTVAK
ncbi:hypothetical protein CONLIGDRAFT_676447 [Coniochaeta ligniaria NRRL 30616]|uniref:Cytochrome c oxidase assembly factor 3 n=1 Tax=Coniochaeta ligniaria NRRL 30616 TaxID=1408157 RepID=A0A1J7J5X3_9PEZI|nr:hypothetical protein CONLIGDRAFT_676447 [Coniochaeta ligniaria NRRL 30616]